MKQLQPLTNEQLRANAPSIFAEHAYEGMSSRYTFVPTIQVVDRLRAEGFQPVTARQGYTRKPDGQQYTRHEIRFQDHRYGVAPVLSHLGQIMPEIVFSNSHNGSSVYELSAGLRRLVCMNGLMVDAGKQQGLRVRHTGSADGIIDATYEVIEQFPVVLEAAESFSHKRLTEPQQLAYADAALALRYENDERPVEPAQMIRPRRREDFERNLWTTFNVVQEHLTQGGPRQRRAEPGQRRKSVRRVTSLNEDAKLNRALWRLTEEMAKLVA